jgi:hypothetical protein
VRERKETSFEIFISRMKTRCLVPVACSDVERLFRILNPAAEEVRAADLVHVPPAADRQYGNVIENCRKKIFFLDACYTLVSHDWLTISPQLWPVAKYGFSMRARDSVYTLGSRSRIYYGVSVLIEV